MKEEPLTVNIRDLGVVAALVTCGIKFTDIYRTSGQVYFVFCETTALDEVVNGYYAGTLQLKAIKFFDNIKMIKGFIYVKR